MVTQIVIGPYLAIHGKFNGIKRPKQKRLIEKNIIAVRYLNLTRNEIKTLFDEKNERITGRKLSYFSLRKYTHKKFKKAKRLTDLCIN